MVDHRKYCTKGNHWKICIKAKPLDILSQCLIIGNSHLKLIIGNPALIVNHWKYDTKG
jgi:hypothetical protein